MSGAAQPRAGRTFEYKVRDDLAANGYWVMRSPASKSPVDMVAVKPGQVLFVQAKLNGRLDPEEWNVLFELGRQFGARPIMARRAFSRRFGVDYVELTGVKDGRTPPVYRQPFVLDEVEASRG